MVKNNKNQSNKPRNTAPKPAISKPKRRRNRQNRPRPNMVGAAMVTGKSSSMTSITVTKSERIGVVATGAAQPGIVLTQYVNAGNLANTTNSYLARQAQLFDKYQFSKFEIEYVPLVSTSTGGNVIIGMDISANDTSPVDATGMTNLSLGYSEGNVWRGFKYAAQCFACFPSGPKYVRSGTTQLGETASLYDMGALYIYTEGAPINTTLGYVDVHYTVHLHGVNRNSGENLLSLVRPVAKAKVQYTGSVQTPGGLWGSTQWGTFQGYPAPSAGNSVVNTNTTFSPMWGNSTWVSGGSGGTFTLQAGTYEIQLTATVASDTYASGNVALTWSGGTAIAAFGWPGSTTAPSTYYVQSSTVTTPSQVVTLAAATVFTLNTTCSYSATFTAGKTWQVITANSSSLPFTSVEITLLQGA
jgi:hypothetical protein